MISDYIPFVNTRGDCKMLAKYFAESRIVRVPLEAADSLESLISDDLELWIDPGVDGYEHHLNKRRYPIPRHLRQYEGSNLLANPSEFRTSQKHDLLAFVSALMNACLKLKPSWITIPQLPICDGTERNRINAELARSTNEWRLNNGFKGRLVLPIIFTHQNQMRGKTKWKARVDSAIKCYHASGADCLWVVDSSLSDQKGTSTLPRRFNDLVQMHSYLKDCVHGSEIIAGPYWGMNLILWARNLCHHPSISLGTAYQYHLSGAPFRRKGKSRIAVASLKRWVVLTPNLRDWLSDAIENLNSAVNTLSSKETVFQNLERVRIELGDELDKLSSRNYFLDEESTRNQVAGFYKDWLNKLDSVPKAGRTLALYQDFSSAYVLGRHLPTLPASVSGGAARRPERVAEHFMLNCL